MLPDFLALTRPNQLPGRACDATRYELSAGTHKDANPRESFSFLLKNFSGGLTTLPGSVARNRDSEVSEPYRMAYYLDAETRSKIQTRFLPARPPELLSDGRSWLVYCHHVLNCYTKRLLMAQGPILRKTTQNGE